MKKRADSNVCPLLLSAVRHIAIGPYPKQLVVPIAVRKAVSAATITFTASSITLCFFMIQSPFFLPLE